MIFAYNFAPGRRGASTQIVIEGFAACAGIAITVVPAIANAPAIATIEYFFKVSPFMSLAPALVADLTSCANTMGGNTISYSIFNVSF
jgi:hypothetical protein